MKTLKFFLTVFVLMTFLALTSYSQGNVKTTTNYGPIDLVGVQLPGVPETVTGSFSGIYTVWNFKWQWRANGRYVGDGSGTIYYTSAIQSGMTIDWIPGKVTTEKSTIHIKDNNGNIYYNSHYNGHMTINAKGAITAEISNAHE